MDIEIFIRLSAFFGVFLIVAYFEARFPRRSLRIGKAMRWLNNLGLVLLNGIILRLVFPAAAVGIAALCTEQGWGLLNQVELGLGLSILISLLVLDLLIYFQHIQFHAVPLLWRLHMVHHTDLDYDVTTGLRFHPIEILLSMLIKAAAILALGPPVVAVIIFEVILNACAMFNHGNLHLPDKLDRALRLILVTPDMHRVHHSTIKRETNSNYGFSLSIWDRLFGTYRAQPSEGHEGMTIGLRNYQETRLQHLGWLLSLPFFAKVAEYPINRERTSDEELPKS